MTETRTATVSIQRTPAQVAEEAVRCSSDMLAEFVAACPLGEWRVVDNLALVRSHIPLAPFNGVWGLYPDVTVDAVRAAVDEFVGGDLPWAVQLRPPYPDGIEGSLLNRGLVHTEDIPFMVLTDPSRLSDAIAASPATFRRASSFRDVDALLSLLERGFGMPSEVTRGTFPVQMLTSSAVSSWIATTTEDVSTSMGFVRGGMCGVFNVATPAEHRGHGHGGAVTAHTVREGIAAGATAAYLQASPMGTPVYERLGFVTVERWRQWMPKEYVHE